ncbi:MAG: nicotinamide-nucleotide adenylyltransferase [Candidatus Thermoplasmatota archaeon]|jgi:nicotinamide-nucleotide adenylyltransferase|nr:nicotinamide-nucleotide adenylyltransferase [Candidatus Thermoplasmatota archaeon]MCL5794370.1 nicotinamide-nucleotide adenylyltransferase [Candidatus Thermoplasmatota archaeon]
MRALIVGRFQPFHLGHLEIIKSILKQSGSIIIGIGSAQYSHTLNDPFTAGERHLMISSSLEAEKIYDFYLVPIEDVNSNPLWVAHVESLTPKFTKVYTNNPLVKRLFAEKHYDVHSLTLLNRESWSGTRIRDKMLNGENWRSDVPPQVAAVIDEIDGVNRLRDLSQSDRE